MLDVDIIFTLGLSAKRSRQAVFPQLHQAGVVGIVNNPLCSDNYSYTQNNGLVKAGHRMNVEEIHNFM